MCTYIHKIFTEHTRVYMKYIKIHDLCLSKLTDARIVLHNNLLIMSSTQTIPPGHSLNWNLRKTGEEKGKVQKKKQRKEQGNMRGKGEGKR